MYNDSDRIVEFPALKEAQETLDAKRKALADVLAESGPNYDMAQVKSLSGDSLAKVEEIRKMHAEIDDLGGEVAKLLVVGRAAAAAKQEEKAAESGDGAAELEMERKGSRRRLSMGETFVKSAAFKEYRAGGGGPLAELEGFTLKTLFQTTNDQGAGWDPEDLRTGRVELTPTRPAPHVVNFIPQTTTTMSAVVYMEETTYTNAAAETKEGGGAAGTDTYPEAALALTERSSQVRKIAVWIPVTDEQFEDEPRARDYVNNRLPFMIRQRMDSQILTGNGTAPNLRGVENVAGINTQALGADSIPDAVYKGIRKCRDTGFSEPNVMFIAPSKWESVRLLKTADGQYIWGHPSMVGPFTLWGVPVVETTAVTSTKVVLGDFANFSELATKRGLDVQVTNSHDDFFIKGQLAIRADVRAAFVVYRPLAFCAVTGL